MNSDPIDLLLFVPSSVPLLKYELLILPVHRSSPPVLVGFVLLDLLFSVWRFVDRCSATAKWQCHIAARGMGKDDEF
jgi:hypothetical protein